MSAELLTKCVQAAWPSLRRVPHWPVQPHSLQSRILTLFLLLTILVQVGGSALINTVGLTAAHKSVADDFGRGERVLNQLLDQNAHSVVQTARSISSDYTLRKAIATGDHATIASVLDKHRKGIDASLMMIVGLDQRVLGDTLNIATGKPFGFARLITEAGASQKGSAMVAIRGELYQLVVTPVLASRSIGWVVIGFNVNDRLAQNLGRLTRLDVSFFSQQASDSWQLQASTLSEQDRAALLSNLSTQRLAKSDWEGDAGYTDEPATRIIALPTLNDDRAVAVLQESLSLALEPFRHLQRLLAFISLAGVLLTTLFSVAIARRLARPLRELASVALRIAARDYSTTSSPSNVVEIQELGAAFRTMQECIASRESQLLDSAHRDALTQLPNRILCNDRLDQAIASAERNHTQVAVLLMDLDHFKYVNDTLGHPIGDLMLRAITSRLEGVVKRHSDTIARLGGDEFAIILPGDDAIAAQNVAKTILQSLELPMLPEGHNLDVRASIGIAVYPEHGNERTTLLRHADVAMYAAKRNKLGYALWNEDYDEYSRRRLVLMNDLRRAVDRDEFTLLYQPKVLLKRVNEYHAEALVRWRHPSRGLLMPSDFITFAEQSGYVRAITQWVLAHAIAQCAKWRNDGLPVHVSINISAHDLMDVELPDRFAALLERRRCSADWITLEITESAILDDPNHGIRNLERLSALGSKLAIDDYGTGYSSLAYLRRLPVQELKLDKSFVVGMNGDTSDSLIVRSTIDLAHSLGLSVAAEGVEDQATLEGLRALGCDAVQGFLLSPPLEATALAEWMQGSAWTRTLRDAVGLRRVV